MVIAKSVRYSCAIDRKPLSMRIGYFVVTKATAIMISNGMEASRVKNPAKIKAPQMISNAPVNEAQNSGCSKPIFAKRPAPTAPGVINFCSPSERKTKPTTSRGINVGADDVVKILFFIPVVKVLVAERRSVGNFYNIKFKVRSTMAVVTSIV